jgi:hypothetical protein
VWHRTGDASISDRRPCAIAAVTGGKPPRRVSFTGWSVIAQA